MQTPCKHPLAQLPILRVLQVLSDSPTAAPGVNGTPQVQMEVLVGQRQHASTFHGLQAQ